MKKKLCGSILLLFFLSACRSSILEDPSTVINYTVPQESHVKLTVENNYNTEIATLVDKVLTPGYYASAYNASSLLEGVYFYTLECKGVNSDFYFKQTKQFLVIK